METEEEQQRRLQQLQQSRGQLTQQGSPAPRVRLVRRNWRLSTEREYFDDATDWQCNS